MQTKSSEPFRHTYGFRFKDTFPFEPAQLQGVGWENVNSTQYDWKGISRTEQSLVLFQYTLSGQGVLRWENNVHRLGAGKAFLVKIPSDHHYYFSEDSEHWEFLYITLRGEMLMQIYDEVVERFGYLHDLSADSGIIRTVKTIFEKAKLRQITDGYLASSHAYRFLVELYRSAMFTDSPSEIPESINNAINFIELHYDSVGSLDEIAEVSGLSKYYFLRQFHKYMGNTPLEYLSRLRIEKAAGLLRTTDKSLEEIAHATGFSNSNYFSKVFRQWVGVAPGKFRHEQDLTAADHLFIR